MQKNERLHNMTEDNKRSRKMLQEVPLKPHLSKLSDNVLLGRLSLPVTIPEEDSNKRLKKEFPDLGYDARRTF